jgi:RNAse (barnase) inhibitor barstar
MAGCSKYKLRNHKIPDPKGKQLPEIWDFLTPNTTVKRVFGIIFSTFGFSILEFTRRVTTFAVRKIKQV